MIYDNPPPYESAVGSRRMKAQPQRHPHPTASTPKAPPTFPSPAPHPSLVAGPAHIRPGTTVHHYVHLVSGEHIATVLPPTHPEMICLQEGKHVRRTKFGLLGVLAAVFFFPLGVGLCLLDRRVKCDRCGRVLGDGVSCG